jgi:inner membrane protein
MVSASVGANVMIDSKMASLGHIAVGMVAGRLQGRSGATRVALAASMLGWSALSMLPDADVIGFRFGVPYAAPFGHRGATHSFMFAVAVAVAAWFLAAALGADGRRFAVLSLVVVGSHALLDTLTDGGLGCALFWPFSARRYFAPWNPIPVAPIGARFFSQRGLSVAARELLMFAPVFLYALWPRPGSRSPREG